MASDVISGMMKQDKKKPHRKSISILGVPHDAVRVFIRFLYSSWYFIFFLLLIFKITEPFVITILN